MAIPMYLATVLRTEAVTPLMQRVTIGGPGLHGFTSTGVSDERIKVVFHRDLGEPALPQYSEQGVTFPEGARVPTIRTYTVRGYDPALQELTVDFALHMGGEAAEWAVAAGPGTPVGIAGPAAGTAVLTAGREVLLVGDKSSLPAISRIIEDLPRSTVAYAFLLIEGVEEQQRIESDATVTITWIHDNDEELDSLTPLEDALRSHVIPGEEVFVWAAGEASAMRSIRRYFRDELALDRSAYNVAGYWRWRLNEDEAITTHVSAVTAAAEAGATEAQIEDAGIY